MENTQKTGFWLTIGKILAIIGGVGLVCSFVISLTPFSKSATLIFEFIALLAWGGAGVLGLGLPFLSGAYVQIGSDFCTSLLSGTSTIPSKVFGIVLEASFALIIISLVITLLKRNNEHSRVLRIVDYVFLGLMVLILILFLTAAMVKAK